MLESHMDDDIKNEKARNEDDLTPLILQLVFDIIKTFTLLILYFSYFSVCYSFNYIIFS